MTPLTWADVLLIVSDPNDFQRLRRIFDDEPDLLDIMSVRNLESAELLRALQDRAGLFADPVAMWVAGRTHAGKTSLGNRLFGRLAMAATGHVNCTDTVGLVKLKSNLWFVDTPGGGSKEDHENIARVGLGLPQLQSNTLSSLTIRDYTNATCDDGGVCGIDEEVVSPQRWAAHSSLLRPDVVVLVIAPHMLFLGDDGRYLRDILRLHGDRVLIVLNLFHRDGVPLFTPANVEDTFAAVGEVYRQVSPDGQLQPRFVQLDPFSGSGLPDLVDQICHLIPAGKLGNMRSVLGAELKPVAERERDRRFSHTVNRVAARLSRCLVDGQVWNQDLLKIAAIGLAQYAADTYRDTSTVGQLGDELQALVDGQVASLKRSLTQPLISTDVRTGRREIIQRVPILDTIETTMYRKKLVTRQLVEHTPKGLMGSLGVIAAATARDVRGLLARQDTHRRAADRARTLAELSETSVREVTEEVEEPIVRLEQRVFDYRNDVIDTVDEVVSLTKQQVGTRAQEGGAPVIEFLAGLGLGIRAHALAEPDQAGDVTVRVKEWQDRVHALLDLRAAELDELITAGPDAEPRIVSLLDGCLQP
jgi:hypothetical protein